MLLIWCVLEVIQQHEIFMKNSPHDVQTKGGGGGQRPFEQCSKKLHFSYGTASLSDKVTYRAVWGQLKNMNELQF